MPAGKGCERIPSLVIALVVLFSLGEVAVAQQGGSSPEAAFDLSSVLPVGTAVPDLGGARVAETGRLFAIDEETFAVWARISGEAQGWVLLGVREGRVETIAQERISDELVRDVKAGLLRVRRQELGVGSKRGWSVVAGAKCVLLQEKPLEEIPSGGTNPIHVWDTQGLRRLFGAGDTIAFRGTTYRCATATLGNANSSGAAVIAFTTSAPAKGVGLALHDAKGLRAVMTDDQPLPGTADARLKVSAVGCGVVRMEEAVLGDDGAVVLVAYLKDDRGTRKGVLSISETATEVLVGAGDPCPPGAVGKVRSCFFKVLDADSASHVAAAFSCRQQVAGVWNGAVWTLVDSGELNVDQAALVAPGSPALLWQGSADREEKRGGEVRKLHAEGWGLFTGTVSRDLRSLGNNPTGYAYVPSISGMPGLTLQYGWGVQGFPDRFIDASAPEKGAQELPLVQTSVGGVPLSNVLAWLGSDSAFVAVRGPGFDGPRVSAGIYLVKRRRPAQP